MLAVLYVAHEAAQFAVWIRRYDVEPFDLDTEFGTVEIGKLFLEKCFNFSFRVCGILRIAHQLYAQIVVGFLYVAELGDSSDSVWYLAQLKYGGILAVFVLYGVV